MEWLFDKVRLLCPVNNIDKEGAIWVREGRIYALLTPQESRAVQRLGGLNTHNDGFCPLPVPY